jgi:methylmalonyl-CoA mutase cobalamin-binding subunit/DNA-binding transcriptional MerR regulator
MPPEPSRNASLHPMRVVVLRTGLTPDLLRAWEKRYAVVSPRRSRGGQRLYSGADIARLTLLVRAVSGGRAIGQVARLPERELEAIVNNDAAALRATPVQATARSAELRASAYAAALDAVDHFKAADLQSTLRGGTLRLGMDEMLDGVIGPLLVTIGNRWHEGTLRPAHEHLASDVIRRTLIWMLENCAPTAGARTLVVATLVGQTHELGTLLVAAAASSHGWRVVYLGTSLPASEIAAAATRTLASAVALSFVYPADDPAIAGAVRELRAALPANTAILAGGRAAPSYSAALAAARASQFATIGELRTWFGDTSRGGQP